MLLHMVGRCRLMVDLCTYCHNPTELDEEGYGQCVNPYCPYKLLARIEKLEKKIASLDRRYRGTVDNYGLV